MYSYHEALSIVQKTIAGGTSGENDIAIDEERSSEYKWGWVFVYDSKKYIETGDPRYALIGNGPILFNRRSGEIRHTGSAHGIAHYVAEYEAELVDEDWISS